MSTRTSSPGLNPVQLGAIAVHKTFEQLGQHINGVVQSVHCRIDAGMRELAHATSAAVHHFNAELASVGQAQAPHSLPAFASVSANNARSGSPPSPAFDLAYNPEEIKKRLSGVPVYAVVNQKNEFVLVSGDETDARQLGMFFFDQSDAEELVATVKEQNPNLGRHARVLRTTMDAVYEFAVTPRTDSGTDGVVFRFMPGASEIQAALELYQAAGLQTSAFTGVPLFQAEGLTVRGESARYTPLFFSKKDLDAALKDAYLSRDTEAQADARAKVERAKAELADARAEAKVASDARAKRAAERKAEAAAKRVEKYEKRLKDATGEKKLPRVDVGCLEEVIVKMETDDNNEWSDVMFVPPGAITSAIDQNQQNTSSGKNGKAK